MAAASSSGPPSKVEEVAERQRRQRAPGAGRPRQEADVAEGGDEAGHAAASWAHQRGGGERGDALAAAGEAEPFGGGGLDADPLGLDARRCGRAPARMAAACGPIFGASQTSVQSRWLTAKPRSVARSTALRRKISEAAPFQAGSDGGNHWPMSPSASAPKMASVSACMPTSASEWPTRPRVEGDGDAAEGDPVAGAEGVHVEAVAGSDIADVHGALRCGRGRARGRRRW